MELFIMGLHGGRSCWWCEGVTASQQLLAVYASIYVL